MAPAATTPKKRQASHQSENSPNPKRAKPNNKPRDPKQSHLYTDDNPSTTLHGTGFKDAETAHHTISLVSQRSLTYQWQVINTMYHRAKGHPTMKKGKNCDGIKAAMGIFREWLDQTYPDAREKRRSEGREFKPLLKKEVVEKYLERVKVLESAEGTRAKDLENCKRFATVYVELGKGKRLANVLVDDEHPEQEDWEVRRERALVALTKAREGEGEIGLWNERGGLSDWHLQCVGWAWSPVGEKRLPP